MPTFVCNRYRVFLLNAAMNISTEVELGLKRLCNPALINDKCFETLLKKAEKRLGTLLDNDATDQLTDDGKN